MQIKWSWIWHISQVFSKFKKNHAVVPKHAVFTVRDLSGHLSPTEDDDMAASLRLGRQGVLFGLRLSNINKCSRPTHPRQQRVRHFFPSPWLLGECWHFVIRAACVLVCARCSWHFIFPLMFNVVYHFSYFTCFICCQIKALFCLSEGFNF